LRLRVAPSLPTRAGDAQREEVEVMDGIDRRLAERLELAADVIDSWEEAEGAADLAAGSRQALRNLIVAALEEAALRERRVVVSELVRRAVQQRRWSRRSEYRGHDVAASALMFAARAIKEDA
jgi:hypothetical protein